MLNVRVYGEEPGYDCCSPNGHPAEAAKLFPENLKPLHDFLLMHGIRLSESIENTMENLQNVFVEALHEQLELCDMAHDTRFVLSLSDEGQLLVEGNGATTLPLQHAIDAKPSLSVLFAQIRARAVLLQGIEDIQSGLNVCLDHSKQDTQTSCAVYKICIKGPLSHFYLQ